LKNNGLLPLKEANLKRILVTGPNANNHALLGDWVKQQPEDKVTIIYEGIQAIGATKGCVVDFYDSNPDIRSLSKADIAGAVRAAQGYDYVVVVVGDNSMRHIKNLRTAGENMARADIDLAGQQLELVQALKGTEIPPLVIHVNGKPIAEPWIDANADALIEAWEPGSFGEQAVAHIRALHLENFLFKNY
jgi:beta-glucosidase